jgi:hypothetical protein
MDARLRSVEDYVTAETALDRARAERSLSTRARLGLLLTGLIGASGIALNLLRQ